MRIGLVGLDNSHCTIFTGMLNDQVNEYHIAGANVVAAYRGGSAIFSLSKNRIDGLTQEVTAKYGVPLYGSIEELAGDVDAILLESCDGRQHLEQFEKMAVGKPVFVDKPLATSSEDAAKIIGLARKISTPIMSCSSLRFAAGIADLLERKEPVVSCEAFGYTPILGDYPGFFWYGVHGAEILFSFMGAGCETVRCLPSRDTDILVGDWKDKRVGVLRAIRFKRDEYGCVVHADSGAKFGLAMDVPSYFYLLMQSIVQFFKTGISPVSIEETYDIVAFLEAANISKDKQGAPARTRKFFEYLSLD